MNDGETRSETWKIFERSPFMETAGNEATS